jgi:hypothetical protein
MAKKTTVKKNVKPSKDVSTTVHAPKEAVEAESKPQNGIVKVKCLQPFFDLQAQCNRKTDEEFEVAEDRAATLTKLRLVVVL